ncbi:carboxylesterase family protein [Chitinophaga polysaccharea]|uniref:carboxylesterase family protein n=1 Tax=Chitinophaga polysaccharea TaxID=1293035 RepID=UPI0011A8E7A7|nr:dienelactone hydrolase family protein [Chitinophaga polysaccharea]
MKKRIIKILNYIIVLSISALISCKKTETAAPVDNTPPVEDSFSRQTVGITAQKIDTKGNISDYLLYIPDGYNEKKSYKWPVVFFLHGVGEMGNNVNVLKNVGLVKVAGGKPFVIIAPQCLSGWWNPQYLDILYKEVLEKYHVDPTRVYLTGLSMGGFGTWDWSSARPEKFAAIIPISGGGDVNRMPNLKAMPIWAFHSADDPTVNVSNTRVLVNALKALGSNVKYTEYPDGGHDAWTRTYANANVYTWLLAQHK